eukprot:CAMPEP_0174232474 /NCGR_PEP_ID=MMETSP0417-20130205/2751_1 /TAXON_ID=242541 /ORGANISM="Mayorella sp, Strain BSH-02190019" /LENGTH=155 /DNA_ID=CAMNT_0015310537 /DNA_START=93 /DNA_END=557 /DNA_ORIENTATION=-
MFGATQKCHKCGKTVYAVEKLNILDKTWHKWCFKCDTCQMTLTMKNYSAVGGVPYCKAHYPAPGASDAAAEVSASGTSKPNYQSGVQPAYQVAIPDHGTADTGGYAAPAAYSAPAAQAAPAAYSAPAAEPAYQAEAAEGYYEGEAEGYYEGEAEG